MNEYEIVFSVDATLSIRVTASNENEAQLKASNKVQTPMLCNQCSRKVTLGDILEVLDIPKVI